MNLEVTQLKQSKIDLDTEILANTLKEVPMFH